MKGSDFSKVVCGLIVSSSLLSGQAYAETAKTSDTKKTEKFQGDESQGKKDKKQQHYFGVGVFNTLFSGLGGVVAYRLNDSLTIKGQASGIGLKFGKERDISDVNIGSIDYYGKYRAETAGIILGWHPFKGSFHINAGLLKSNYSFKILNNSGTDVSLEDRRFAFVPKDSVGAKIKFDSLAPYAGLGWGRVTGKGFNVIFEIGASFLGTADVEIINKRNLLTKEEVEDKKRDAKKALDNLILPEISFSISYGW